MKVRFSCTFSHSGAADPGGQGGQLPTQYLRESPLGGKNYVEKTIFLSPIKNFLPPQSKFRSAAPDGIYNLSHPIRPAYITNSVLPGYIMYYHTRIS